ncbi:hypothetical protein [Streptomyces sp. NPDC058623]|uniref:hypothetical protein n=1 Tax=Streptomyces sp. NPDC058623 TaxID=3346563 RepID=UPI00365523B7
MTAPHTTRTGAGLRTTRAAVFAAVCVVLSAVGHVVASCAAVPWWALVSAFAAVFAVAAPLSGRRRSPGGIAAVLALGQVGLHTLFGLGQHDEAAARATAADSDTSLAALAARLVCGGNSVPLSPADARRILETAGLDPVALAGQAAVAQGHAAHEHVAEAAGQQATGLFSPAMLAGHLVAALAVGWLLGRGDAALLRLLELSRLSTEADPVRPLRAALAFVRALAAGIPGAPVRTRRTGLGAAAPAAGTGREALQHTVIRRGPPAGLSLAA